MDKGYLKYILENCETAFDELCRINKELLEGMSPESNADVNRLGALNRMIQDYLVIRVAGLFDKDTRTISFENLFPNNADVAAVEQEAIIEEIIKNRMKFVAHSEKSYIANDKFAIKTSKICNSNLKELLARLKSLVS